MLLLGTLCSPSACPPCWRAPLQANQKALNKLFAEWESLVKKVEAQRAKTEELRLKQVGSWYCRQAAGIAGVQAGKCGSAWRPRARHSRTPQLPIIDGLELAVRIQVRVQAGGHSSWG